MPGSRILVVDASVALKWVLQEDNGVETARALLRDENYMLAPWFWMLECGHAIRRQAKVRGLDSEAASRLYAFLMGVPVVMKRERELAADAFAMSLALNHSIYDCTYLALARSEQVPLVTADVELAKVATRHGMGDMVELIGPDHP